MNLNRPSPRTARQQRENERFVTEQMRAAERAARLLGLCPVCGGDATEPHVCEPEAAQ